MESLNKQNKPIPNRTSFAHFLSANSIRHMQCRRDIDVNYTDLYKTSHEQWLTMMTHDKEEYNKMARDDKIRYHREIAACGTPEPLQDIHPKKEDDEPKVPKPCLPAFYWFCKNERATVEREYPEYDVKKIAKELTIRWCNVDTDVKRQYDEKENEDRVRYMRDRAAYDHDIVESCKNASQNKSIDEVDDILAID